MPFIKNTPEALLPRSDSKNPATTCKGITSNGRPCRRSLAASPQPSPGRRPSGGNGVLAVLHDRSGQLGNDAAAFYCWQHKDQATDLTSKSDGNAEIFPLKQRSSIDTLVDRLGVLDIDQPEEDRKRKKHKRHREHQGIKKRDTLPQGWQEIPGPLLTVPEERAPPKRTDQHSRPVKERPVRRTQKHINIFCCTQAPDNDPVLPPRPHHAANTSRPLSAPRPQMTQIPRPNHSLAPPSPTKSPARPSNASTPIRRRPVSNPPEIQRLTPNQTPTHTPRRQSDSTYTPGRTSLPGTPNSTTSQTQTLLSLIPPTLPPQTTSLLLTELSKPLPPSSEAGYIYIFWLTPDSQPAHPADSESTSLLAPSPATASRTRRTSDVLQRYGSVSRRAPTQKTVLLKIGRAANVQRRLQQWSKQCEHNLSLIRYYPYIPSSSSSSTAADPSPAPRKVPHVHRVERLIHIELAEKRVKNRGPCGSCGKEHREWFEIEARAAELRAVDEVVRRWVGWGEEQG
ncbi:MAG: hypothetical protein Q9160_008368 [Pyrenula sp. 1 TL-2023]